jgi:hypothetical protein
MYKDDIGAKREQPILLKQGNSIYIEQAAYILSDNDYIPYVQVYTVDGNYDSMYADNTFEKQKWAMLTVSYDGKNIKYYKNGTLIGNKACAGSIPASSGKLLIGFNEYDGSSFFKGVMDELRIYNHVLTPEQVKVIYDPHTTPPRPAPTTSSNTPVPANAPSTWAVAEIDKAKELKLTTEKILDKYQTNITREEFCELAVKLYEALSGKNAEAIAINPFKDTTNQEVLKAFNLKIVTGISADKFAPSNPVTRQEISVMIIRTINAAKPGLDTAVSDTIKFADDSSIAPWAKNAVKLLNKNDIMKGSGTGEISIMPKGNTSREQAVILVKRTFENFSRYIWAARPEGGGEWKIKPEGGGEW